MNKLVKVALISISILGILAAPAVLAAPIDDFDPIPPVVPTIDCSVERGAGGPNAGLCNVVASVNIILLILMILVVVYFIWGITKYLTSGGDPEKAAAAKQQMIYGVIGIAVIFGVNVLLNYIGTYMGMGLENTINIPFFGT